MMQFIIPVAGFAILMSIVRTPLTGETNYLYMNWNLFLALVPLFLLYLFEKEHNPILRWFTFFLWLLFLPNAVYLITDFIHLRETGPDWLLWYDGMMIFTYALVGVVVSAFTLNRMKKLLFRTWEGQQVFVLIMALLSSFGIYLGRYLRFNSWDFFTKPLGTISHSFRLIGEKYDHPVFITSMIFFTLFILMTECVFDRISRK